MKIETFNTIMGIIKNIPIERVAISCKDGNTYESNTEDIVDYSDDEYIELNSSDMQESIYIDINSIVSIKKGRSEGKPDLVFIDNL